MTDTTTISPVLNVTPIEGSQDLVTVTMNSHAATLLAAIINERHARVTPNLALQVERDAAPVVRHEVINGTTVTRN